MDGRATFKGAGVFNKYCEEFRAVTSRILRCVDDQNSEMDYVKYHLDKWLWRFNRSTDPAPEKPKASAGKLFRGILAFDLARAVQRRGLSDASFLYSLQKGTKQGWVAANENRIETAWKKHARLLGDCTRPGISLSLFEAIRDLAEETYGQKKPEYSKFLPTDRASIFFEDGRPQKVRSTEGSLSLTAQAQVAFLTEPKQHAKLERLGLVHRIQQEMTSWRQTNYDAFKRRYHAQQALTVEPPELDRVPYPLVAQDLLHSRTKDGDDRWQFVCGDDAKVRIREGQKLTSSVSCVALTEPGGKVRMISAGNSFLYSILQPLQGHLLETWKNRPESTMRNGDLTASMQRMYDITKKFDRASDPIHFVSGDYAAATDTVSRDTTEANLQGLGGLDIPATLMQSARNSFLPGLMTYRNFTDEYVAWRMNGQLMGHPLSFPFLCVTNLAVFRLSISDWIEAAHSVPGWKDRQAEVRFRTACGAAMRKTVKVNGDDVAFLAPASFVPFWRARVADAGFVLSVGKNYVCRDFIQINSQVFLLREGKMIRVGYFNQTLVTGSVKKQRDDSSDVSPFELAKSISETFRLCPCVRLAAKEIMERARAIYGLTLSGRGPNWFLPVHLGGLGMPIELCPETEVIEGVTIPLRVTPFQRKLAAEYVYNPKLRWYVKKGSELPRELFDCIVGTRKVIPGDYVPREYEMREDEPGGPLDRLMCLSRMAHCDVFVKPQQLLKRPQRSFRLKPMSRLRLAQLWGGFNVIVPRRVSFPPLPPIRV